MIHRELRLALICYGGVSLAVYMHGITREVWHLVRASRDRTAGEPAMSAVTAIYAELLDELEDRAGLRLRVVNDIVAGASAGGLNGVFLARAIATGQSLEPLTRLWLDSADVEMLMSEDARPFSRLTKAWAEPIAWYAARRGGALDRTVADDAKDEIGAKLSQFVRARWFAPPFSGETFCNLILDALGAMAAAPAGPPLLPPGLPLDLFVTATDFHGSPQQLTLHSPPQVEEREHRLVFTLRGRAGALASDAALTMAGRATASFPGAFPPATVAELDTVLARRGETWPERAADLTRLLPRRAAAGTVEDAVLIDGSVLTNAPFGPALAALNSRPAKRPVDRRFVYLDPTPGHGQLGERDGPPGFFGTIFGALSSIPRQQPIRDDLEAIAARTARIERVARIVASLQPTIAAQVDEAVGRPLFFDRPTADRLIKWSEAVATKAAARAGVALTGYRALRLNQLCERLATLLPGAADDPAATARLVGRLWTELAETDDRREPLALLDAQFRSRRLRRLARTVAAMQAEGAADAATLEPVRQAVFALLNDLETGADAIRDCGVLADLLVADAPVRRLVERAAQLRALPAFDRATAEALATVLAPLDAEPRRRLLRDWLGFPVLDLATLPLAGNEPFDEFDAIKVDRIAPEDATSLRAADETTIRGVEFNHFGAFFSRRYRENDYLWGRLHGAERMVDLVLSTLPPGQSPPADWTAAIKARLFGAIVAEERDRLGQSGALLTAIDGDIDRLAKGARSG